MRNGAGASDQLYSAEHPLPPEDVLALFEAQIDEELSPLDETPTGDTFLDEDTRKVNADLRRDAAEMREAAAIVRQLLKRPDGIEQMCRGEHTNGWVQNIGMALRDHYYRDLAI